MPKYLIEANYVGEGVKGLLKDGGSSRRAAVEKLFCQNRDNNPQNHRIRIPQIGCSDRVR